jgi:hypothetical protein
MAPTVYVTVEDLDVGLCANKNMRNSITLGVAIPVKMSHFYVVNRNVVVAAKNEQIKGAIGDRRSTGVKHRPRPIGSREPISVHAVIIHHPTSGAAPGNVQRETRIGPHHPTFEDELITGLVRIIAARPGRHVGMVLPRSAGGCSGVGVAARDTINIIRRGAGRRLGEKGENEPYGSQSKAEQGFAAAFSPRQMGSIYGANIHFNCSSPDHSGEKHFSC